MLERVLLSAAYLAPVQYYSKLIRFEKAEIEVEDHYEKQSYRTRCVIAGANGPLTLGIPVEKHKEKHYPMRDVRIAYYEDWQRLHVRSMVSAYQTSPYFEYLWDDLARLYERHWDFLLDFDMRMQEVICGLLQIDNRATMTKEYRKECGGEVLDCRSLIRPQDREGREDRHFEAKEYYQVFGLKQGFVKNLSIADLLFNMGGESRVVLRDCWKD